MKTKAEQEMPFLCCILLESISNLQAGFGKSRKSWGAHLAAPFRHMCNRGMASLARFENNRQKAGSCALPSSFIADWTPVKVWPEIASLNLAIKYKTLLCNSSPFCMNYSLRINILRECPLQGKESKLWTCEYNLSDLKVLVYLRAPID